VTNLWGVHTIWVNAIEALENEKSKEIRVVFNVVRPPWRSFVTGYFVVKVFDPQDKFYSVKWYPTWDEHIKMRTFWRTRRVLEGNESHSAIEKAWEILREFGGVMGCLFSEGKDAPFQLKPVLLGDDQYLPCTNQFPKDWFKRE